MGGYDDKRMKNQPFPTIYDYLSKEPEENLGIKGAKVFDAFYMFKKQLEDFIDFVKTGKFPYSYEVTVEQIKVVLAGLKSRENGGKRIFIK